MAIVPPRVRRDDRVLGYTRVLSAVIIPFLLTAFVVLYLFPGDTKRLFAWSINCPLTAMVLASAYLGGAYFFIRVLREPHWSAVKTGFISVALFASLLGRGHHSPLGQVQPSARRVLAMGGSVPHHTVPGLRRLARQPTVRRASQPG